VPFCLGVCVWIYCKVLKHYITIILQNTFKNLIVLIEIERFYSLIYLSKTYLSTFSVVYFISQPTTHILLNTKLEMT
jgi:hypothetical protein